MGSFTQASSNRTYTRGNLFIRPDNVASLHVLITDDAGKLIEDREVVFPLSGPVVDGSGLQLAAAVPTGINTARAGLLSAIDTAIDAAAAAGKFNR